MAELVDAHGSGPCAARREGSSPFLGTNPPKSRAIPGLRGFRVFGRFCPQGASRAPAFPSPRICDRHAVALITTSSARGTMSPARRLTGTNNRSSKMDWNRVEGNWKQMSGKVKEQWGKLTDDDLTEINGKREQLEGKLQERYGKAKDEVTKDIDTWYDRQTW
jgi:uncharacterized protein YjbJ (UPF0337 family)